MPLGIGYKDNAMMCFYLCNDLVVLIVTQKPNQPMGKPEVTIDLRDAEIIYTSEVVLARKNIIIVSIFFVFFIFVTFWFFINSC